jgi:predicted enzyme related to lactoylglutathione lyase
MYADDVDRAIKFYSDVFGWKLNSWGGPESYCLITTGDEGEPGINGGMMKRHDPSAVGVNIIGVPSVDEFANKIANSGGSIVSPKMPNKGVGYAAYFIDPEGNAFGIFKSDSSAQ